MTEAEFSLVRAGGFLLALTSASALQRLTPHARLRGSVRVNVGLWLIDLALLALVCGACACAVANWAAETGVGLLNDVPAPAWVGIPLTIVALDFVSYAWHRANHRLRFLWRFHQVHHSDPTFTVSTGMRFHPGELLLSLPLRLTAVAALGASAAAVVIFEVIFAIANLVEHGDIDLPAGLEQRLGRICVTPALHRRHHSRRRAELNTNFGTIFVLWDRLLGTYVENGSAVRVETGLPGTASAPRLARALALPLTVVVPER